MIDTEMERRADTVIGGVPSAVPGAISERPKARCLWCGRSFMARRGGKRQRFCLPEHRRAFETAARRYVDRLVTQGRLPVDALHSRTATRALVVGAVSGSGATGVAKTARSRSTSPVRVLWAGYGQDAAPDRHEERQTCGQPLPVG